MNIIVIIKGHDNIHAHLSLNNDDIFSLVMSNK